MRRRQFPGIDPIAVILACTAALAPSGCVGALKAAEAPARPGVLARLPDGRRLNFRCTGAGAPTILLEGGFAATSLVWYKVQALVTKSHRVCAYDRAGYGFSDPGPPPRDGAAVAQDLDNGLRALKISGPFIVVGHSAGGLYVRLFADRRPRDVVGMVLVDPSVEYQDRRLAAVFGPQAGSLAPQRARAEACLAAARAGALPSTDPRLAPCVAEPPSGQAPAVTAARLSEARRPATWETQISELESLWNATSDEVATGRANYGAMPLIVLTADGTYASAPPSVRPTIAALWGRLHAEIAARSSRGATREVVNSSHMMMFDRPDAIVAAIDAVSATSDPEPGRSDRQ